MFKKMINNKLYSGVILFIVILLSITMVSSCSATDNTSIKVPITVQEFGFSHEPLAFNQDLYGYMDANDSMGHTHTYYVTDEQMAGLYYSSNKTFEYPDGLYVTYHHEDDDIMFGNFIIDHIYLKDGTEIQPVSGLERDEFVNNSVNIGKECQLCSEYFGLSTSELADA